MRGGPKPAILADRINFEVMDANVWRHARSIDAMSDLGRASYAQDMSVRKLLTPGERTLIPFSRTPLVSRRMSKGSRLLVLLTINKNRWAQVNYGTGKDVGDESVADAGVPLEVSWYNDSFITVPILRSVSASR